MKDDSYSIVSGFMKFSKNNTDRLYDLLTRASEMLIKYENRWLIEKVECEEFVNDLKYILDGKK